nr:hypothetical protein CFP56_70076 [Quercus suber]
MTTEVAENICDAIGKVVRSIGAETEEIGSFIQDEARPRTSGHSSDTVAESNDTASPMEDNANMETEEFREEFNAEFNTEGVAVTNSKMTSTIKLAANIVEENIQGINSISYNNELKRDSGKTIIGCSWKMNEV